MAAASPFSEGRASFGVSDIDSDSVAGYLPAQTNASHIIGGTSINPSGEVSSPDRRRALVMQLLHQREARLERERHAQASPAAVADNGPAVFTGMAGSGHGTYREDSDEPVVVVRDSPHVVGGSRHGQELRRLEDKVSSLTSGRAAIGRTGGAAPLREHNNGDEASNLRLSNSVRRRRRGGRGSKAAGTKAGGGGSSARKTKPQPFHFHDHPRGRTSREDLQRELDRKAMEECTFQPKITDVAATAMTPAERKARLEQLSKPRDYTRLERQRQERLAAEMEAATFHPRIRPGPTNGASYGGGDMAVEDRLLEAAARRERNRRELLRQREEELQHEYSFRPQTGSNDATRGNAEDDDDDDYRPIYLRVTDIQRKRNEDMHALRHKVQVTDADLTFHPKINRKSAILANKAKATATVSGAGHADVVDRLTDNSAEIARKNALRSELQNAEAATYTFKPKISTTSEIIAQESDTYGQAKTFLERQQVYDARRAEKRRRRQEEEAEERAAAFRPQINPATKLMVNKESFLERCHRLSSVDKQKSDVIKESLAKAYYEQFQFKPKINPRSRRLAKNRGRDDLVAGTRPSGVASAPTQEELAAAAEAEFAAQYPFQPRTNADPKRRKGTIDMRDPSKTLQRIEEQKAAREEELERIRAAKEAAETEGCTFEPQINRKKRVKSKGPIVVRGLGRYLELKELAKKKKEEQAEAERKAFSVAGSALRGKVPTHVPQNASTDSSRRRSRRRARSSKPRAGGSSGDDAPGPRESSGAGRRPSSARRPKRRSRSTKRAGGTPSTGGGKGSHRPRTNAAKNRALIKKILDEDWDAPKGDDNDFAYEW